VAALFVISNGARFIEQANYQMPPTRCRAKLFSRFERIAHRYAFFRESFCDIAPNRARRASDQLE
jgi:hypothetical protein